MWIACSETWSRRTPPFPPVARLTSVFIGGGTPSLFSGQSIADFWTAYAT